MASQSDPTLASLTSYDQTPYPAASHAETHPNRLAAMGRLFGLAAAAPSKARVLEIGCADGSNLLPMAEMAPQATFLGIDASKVQIEAAMRARDAAGLKNVELRCQNILDFPAGAAKFDYIIVHGIFSWVPDAVRERILGLCQECLTDNGIAYVSYNAYPGWHMRRALRDMMLYHTRPFADSATKVGQARALLKFLADSVPTEKNPFGLFLKSELDVLATLPDNYMLHDILEDENTPFYFHEFVERAARHQLQYLSETSLSMMLASYFSTAVQETLTKIGKGIVAQEQYMDFLRNRFFRQTLLCRATAPLRRNLTNEMMREFSIHPHFKVESVAVDYSSAVSVSFTTTLGRQVATTDPFNKVLFSIFSESDARAIRYEDLLMQTRTRSRPYLGRVEPNRDQIDDATLAANLLSLLTKGFVDICAEPVAIDMNVPPKPAVSALMRFQALNTRYVTNRVHQALPVDVFARLLIDACDGTRTVDALAEVLMAAIRDGKMQLAEGGVQVTDPARIRQLVVPRTEQLLLMMAKSGFFAPQ